MKTIIFTITMCLLQILGYAQADHLAQGQDMATQTKCALVYSLDEDALVYKDTAQFHGEELIIESLPYIETLSIPIYISSFLKGYYTFKKHPRLKLPQYFTVIIEDRFTGKRFDLKYSDSYTFYVHQEIPERFILHIDKLKYTDTAMR